RPSKTTTTTNFGWNKDGTCYRVPGGDITADGFQPAADDDGMRVDLDGESLACRLDLHAHPPEKLREVKRHVVEDLLRLHDRRVTYTLLAAVALAVLMRFAGDAYGQFALWLVGLTGSGKSTLARLFQSFFGRFPASMGLASWISTPNFLERQGYFFANAIYA